MKILAHGSPLALEAELLDRVAAAKAKDALASVLVIVPSRRLADHVVRRLTSRFGALLNVVVLHHGVLAERIIERAGAGVPLPLNDDLADRLFGVVLDRAPSAPFRDFTRERPGAASFLRRALDDLRDAGIPADAAVSVLGPSSEIAALYGRWSAALEEILRERNATDEAGLARLALPHAAAFARRYAAVLHHGAYDLIGVHADLVRALDSGREVTFLLPADPAHPSGVFGVERARPLSGGSDVDPLDHEAPRPATVWRTAQGARAELRFAAYEALSFVEAGGRAAEVAIVVRGFGPYLSAIEDLLDDDPTLWSPSYRQPLRRLSGAAAALRAIAAAPGGGPRRWSDHAAELDRTARAVTGGETLAGLLESMVGIETILGDRREVSAAEARAWLESRADVATVGPPGTSDAGVFVLDAMQARGLTFSRIELAGMNSQIFPHPASENPFLPDAEKRALRTATGRPLPVASERDGEERLLLAMMLGSARDRIAVSWRRADEHGRPLVPSLALDEVARRAGIGDDARAAKDLIVALPTHPRARLGFWAEQPGILTPRDETVLAALASEIGGRAADAVLARRPALFSGAALLAATESFDRHPGAYDGRIGVSVLRGSISASALERLGRCPLQFFFAEVLKVPVPDEDDPLEPDSGKTGTRVHDVLERVYRRLMDEGAFEGSEVTARIEQARRILPEVWDQLERERPTADARYPMLAAIERGSWLKALSDFVAFDLARLAETGLVPAALESRIEKEVPGGPPGLTIRGRLDRTLTGRDGPLVTDYKTGRRIASRVDRRAMLTGTALQVPLYALMTGSPIELMRVCRGLPPEVASFDDFKSPEHEAGVLETLRVVAALGEAGLFPIRSDKHCAWCDYASACRRNHPPTAFRNESADDTRDARDCWDKSLKAPTLKAVREAETP